MLGGDQILQRIVDIERQAKEVPEQQFLRQPQLLIEYRNAFKFCINSYFRKRYRRIRAVLHRMEFDLGDIPEDLPLIPIDDLLTDYLDDLPRQFLSGPQETARNSSDTPDGMTDLDVFTASFSYPGIVIQHL